MEDKQTFTFEPTAVGRYLSVRKLYPEKSSSLTLCEVAVTAHVYVKAGQQQTKQTRDIETTRAQCVVFAGDGCARNRLMEFNYWHCARAIEVYFILYILFYIFYILYTNDSA